MIKLIVGLGNPGKKYDGTRHNLGRTVGEVFERRRTGSSPMVLLPDAFMNVSGGPVAEVTRFHKFRPEEIVVIHDDADLPLGQIRLKLGGSAAGHHGVESVISALGNDQFWRLRVGIGRSIPENGKQRTENGDQGLTNYVLGRFSTEEKPITQGVIDAATEILLAFREKEPEPRTWTMEKENAA